VDRRRLYFALMGTCLLLIGLAWLLVWRFSVAAAIGMSVAAMLIPPFAAVVGNAGFRGGRIRDAEHPDGWYDDRGPGGTLG
jgi:hypothetical protein